MINDVTTPTVPKQFSTINLHYKATRILTQASMTFRFPVKETYLTRNCLKDFTCNLIFSISSGVNPLLLKYCAVSSLTVLIVTTFSASFVSFSSLILRRDLEYLWGQEGTVKMRGYGKLRRKEGERGKRGQESLSLFEKFFVQVYLHVSHEHERGHYFHDNNKEDRDKANKERNDTCRIQKHS